MLFLQCYIVIFLNFDFPLGVVCSNIVNIGLNVSTAVALVCAISSISILDLSSDFQKSNVSSDKMPSK